MSTQKTSIIQSETQTKVVKKLLDYIILQFLNDQSMHGYEVITKIRKTFGVYFGPSTVYPLLANLEKKLYITSNWITENDRPRKMYTITPEGQNMLVNVEDLLNHICQKIKPLHITNTENNPLTEQETPNDTSTQ